MELFFHFGEQKNMLQCKWKVTVDLDASPIPKIATATVINNYKHEFVGH